MFLFNHVMKKVPKFRSGEPKCKYTVLYLENTGDGRSTLHILIAYYTSAKSDLSDNNKMITLPSFPHVASLAIHVSKIYLNVESEQYIQCKNLWEYRLIHHRCKGHLKSSGDRSFHILVYSVHYYDNDKYNTWDVSLIPEKRISLYVQCPHAFLF